MQAMRALSIDPGEANLGLALLAFEPQRVARRVAAGEAERVNKSTRQPRLCDTDFMVRWVGLWNLKDTRLGAKAIDAQADADADDVRPNGMRPLSKAARSRFRSDVQQSLAALVHLIETTPVTRRLLGDTRVHVFIEHQEGCTFENAGLTQSLMRMNAVAATIFALFRHHGHRVHFLGKQSKWGWASFKATTDYARMTPEQRRERRKACITYYVENLVRRQQLQAPDGVLHRPLQADEPADGAFYYRLNSHAVWRAICHPSVAFDERAHYSDAIVGAMFAMRAMLQPRNRHVNTIEPAAEWARVRELAEARTPFYSRPRSTAARPSGRGGARKRGRGRPRRW